ncbi:hypothetical protein ACFVFQ_35055 [Streptomyces sp. NPDC057743]|uniref:hypothetical protein n=1 Tax=Streptomyces sp. NPDC057743 TaxID=3346236 RepID=UPI0036988B85
MTGNGSANANGRAARRKAGTAAVATDSTTVPEKPSWTLTAFGVLLTAGVLALAAWLMSFAWPAFAYHAALAGTPGKLTSAHCYVTGSGKSARRECTGTFTALNGTFTDTSAHVYEVIRYTGDGPMRLQRRSDGGYTQPEPAQAALMLGVVCGIVCGAAGLLSLVCVGPRRVTVEKGVSLRANPPPWGVLLLVLSRMTAAAAAAVALSFVMFFVLLIGELVF